MNQPLTVEALRSFAHHLVDQVLDELAFWQENLEPDNLPSLSSQAKPADRADFPSKETRPPADTWPVRHVGHSSPASETTSKSRRGPAPLTTISISVVKQRKCLVLRVCVPATIASRAGLSADSRVAPVVVGRRIMVEEKNTGVKVRTQSASTLIAAISGRAHGLTEAHPSTHCTWHLDEQHHLVVDVPDWWPKEPAARAVPPMPPPSDNLDRISDGWEWLRHGKKPVKSAVQPVDDLGERIDPEFPCHTCGSDDPITAKRATMQCKECGGLYCAGCWISHKLVHKRAGSEHAGVAHV